MTRIPLITLPLAAALVVGACSSATSVTAPSLVDQATDTTSGGTTTTTITGLPAMYAHFGSTVEVFLDGDQVVLRTDDVPNHSSPYFGAGNSGYIAPHAGMVVNPNRIIAQDFEFRLPAAPQSTTASDTSLGAIGIAVNGVVLFNQYAGPNNRPLDDEIVTFDIYNGHPQQTGQYHYHFEPVYVTSSNRAALVGVLLDGFPVYGPVDADGSTPTDLDICNGHIGVTPDHAGGIYHYHITNAFPFISGCYRGSAGSVTN